MPRPAKGYTSSVWFSLPIEEREKIKREHARQAVNKCHRNEYAANIEKKREYNNQIYHANKEKRIPKVREYQQKKKEEHDEYVASILRKLEMYEERIHQLEAMLAPNSTAC